MLLVGLRVVWSCGQKNDFNSLLGFVPWSLISVFCLAENIFTDRLASGESCSKKPRRELHNTAGLMEFCLQFGDTAEIVSLSSSEFENLLQGSVEDFVASLTSRASIPGIQDTRLLPHVENKRFKTFVKLNSLSAWRTAEDAYSALCVMKFVYPPQTSGAINSKADEETEADLPETQGCDEEYSLLKERMATNMDHLEAEGFGMVRAPTNALGGDRWSTAPVTGGDVSPSNNPFNGGMVRAPTYLMGGYASAVSAPPVYQGNSGNFPPVAPIVRPKTTSPQCLPYRVRIFLIRHGESEGNVDLSVYEKKPDHALDLTPKGAAMARASGKFLREYLTKLHGSKEALGHHVRMWVSPYARTRQTAENVLRELNGSGGEPWVDSVRESPFLAEQDFGSFEGHGGGAMQTYRAEFERNLIKKDYQGQFWSRWPNGESCFDVCVRMSAIFSDITAGFMMSPKGRPPIRTVIVVSHGVTIRAFIAAWCRYSPEWVAHTKNPPNCSINLIEDYSDRGCIFGGFLAKHDAPPEEMGAVDLNDVARVVDPRQEAWRHFLESTVQQ